MQECFNFFLVVGQLWKLTTGEEQALSWSPERQVKKVDVIHFLSLI